MSNLSEKQMTAPYLLPPALKPGDKIAIISPATTVKPEYIDGAVEFLTAEGFRPVVMPHAKGPADGSYAASEDDRLTDILSSLRDPEVRAILCARGGYGCNHLISRIPAALIHHDPKWLIGFSDVSALHAMYQRAGVVSLHAPMAKHLATLPPDHYCTRALMRILKEGLPVEYLVPAHPLNIPGEARGILVGGNLAVINGLGGTPFDPVQSALANGHERPILFIEDISEAIYAVERMLIRLHLSGQLHRLGGIIFGAFTEYRPDRNHPDMETMISRLLDRIGLRIPVAFGFPAGHIDDNLPLPLGASVILSVTHEATILTAV